MHQTPIHEHSLEDHSHTTAWMPLEGLMQEWAQVGAQATQVEVLRATGSVFFALAHEKDALRQYHAHETTQENYDKLSHLEGCLDLLAQAHEHWKRAWCSLEPLDYAPGYQQASSEHLVGHKLLIMKQRLRLSLLFHEVESDYALLFVQRDALATSSCDEAIPTCQTEGSNTYAALL